MTRFGPLLALPLICAASVFDTPELRIAPSPALPAQIHLAPGVRVLDFDVSPAGPQVALLTANTAGAREVLFWDIGHPQPVGIWALPAAFAARSIVWHPQAEALFLTGSQGQRYIIVRLEKAKGVWASRQIYTSSREIRRLVAGPRPYLPQENEKLRKPVSAYRLFFGLRAPNGAYSIHSITENGQREYQMLGRRESFTVFPEAGANPSELVAASALPVGFHPAGHLLIWEDAGNCFHVAGYDRDHWETNTPLLGRDLCGGAVSATPNGAGILQWRPGTEGVDLLLQHSTASSRQAAGYQLISAPSSVPDGRGIVGVTRTSTGFDLNYIPVQVPLADVTNAWMYTESSQDTQLLAGHGGLFRDLKKDDQLYQLYDSENYACGKDLDESTPTRPYLVTTDSLWELFAAAYEGMFIVRERQVAMPAFAEFVSQAAAALRQSSPQSPWTAVFAALAALQSRPEASPEAMRILQATGSRQSSVTGAGFDYGELQPRGHYTATPEAQRYFRAFRYLTRIQDPKWSTDELRQLPAPVRAAALRWIASYQEMIASSRAPLVWQDSPFQPAAFIRHPGQMPVLFPLSWGFDNEALFSATYHAELPAAEQIVGAGGPRLLPSALDVAAALGSGFARQLLSAEIAKYPPLNNALNQLAARYQPSAGANLYQQWIDGLAVQWADSVASPNGELDADLWRAKRLQTGLASWATLRHATVLVNERNSAECGEGAFEFIEMRPPRGYVEPDPRTFGRIAELFASAAKMLTSGRGLAGSLPAGEIVQQSQESLQLGLFRRLSETAAKARLFQDIAGKEIRGEPLTADDYEEILYFGRVAEHHFLIYRSLANKDLALSTPNPIPKIADIADVAGSAPYQMAAVGRPLEWDHTVPFFGRRQIVKGAAYSFYELLSDKLLDDADWLKQLPTQPHPAWVSPYVSANELSCPPRKPF